MLSDLRALRNTQRRLTRLALLLMMLEAVTIGIAAWRYPAWYAALLFIVGALIAVLLAAVVIQRRSSTEAIGRLKRGDTTRGRNERHSR